MTLKRRLRRWAAFNAVGAAGMAVQIGVLALLIRGGAVHYLAATLLAVEAALLHNFFWHHRWTWADRPPASMRALAVRLGRFHAVNGVVSVAGNLGIMAILTGALGVDPLAANLIAVLACSLVNFAASDSRIFTTPATVVAGVLLLGVPAPASAGQGGAAIQAWNAYIQELDARYVSSARPEGPFFAQDRVQDAQQWRARIARGEVSTARIEPPDADGGRIHHWTGSVFIPKMHVNQVIDRLIQQAGREADLFEDVDASKLLARDGDRLRVYMKLRRTAVLTATFNTEHLVEYRRLGPTRASSRSTATRIVELAAAGTPQEYERRPGDDRGFLWRLVAYWRFEAMGDGVIVECESVSLSRSAPALTGAIANPIIERVARESLERTLAGLKSALQRHVLSASERP